MILSQSKKYGGRPFACSSNDPFHSFLDSFGMVDLGFLEIFLHGPINVKIIILSKNDLIGELPIQNGSICFLILLCTTSLHRPRIIILLC
jgi:hypothetical protein